MIRKIIVFLLFLCFIFTTSIMAGITGKIAGVIKDKSTGDPLPGVNVLIVGTFLGAATDIDGYFFINNVPPGTYTLKATMMGYSPMDVTNVKVSADITTTINFNLTTQVLSGEEVTIVAERPIIEKELTQTTKVIGTKEIAKMPARTYTAVVAQTAGVLGTSNFRGGQGDEVAWMIDGLSVNDPLSGGRAVNLNNIAIEEVQVLTGGFNAEYGNAMSGVVNVVTKSGGSFYNGSYRWTTDAGANIFSKANALEFGYNDHEFSFGGPVPFTNKKLRFFTTEVLGLRGCYGPRKLDNQIGKLIKEGYDMSMVTDRWPEMAKNPYYLNHQQQQRYQSTFKLSYNLSSNLQLKFSSLIERNQYEVNPSNGVGQTPERSYFFVADQYTSYLRKNKQFWIGITHQITPKTFYELKVTRYSTNLFSGLKDVYKKNADGSILRDENGKPVYNENYSWWQDYKFIPAKYTPGTHDSTAQYNYTDYRNQDWTNPRNPFGVFNNWQAGASSTRRYEERLLSYNGVKFDLTSQITKIHQLKFGFEYRAHEASRDYNSLPWRPDPFQDHYDVYPKIASAYIQNSADWNDLILNAGIRLDYISPNQTHRDDLLDRYSKHVSTKAKYQISPRLGISHPITERTVVHLQYGQFFQQPNFFNLYRNLDPYLARWYDVVGNPDMEAEKTTAYELGVAQQFGNDAKFEVVAYFKDIYNLTGTRNIPVAPYSITQDDNRTYAMSKGVEFNFNKRFSNNWALDLSFTESRSKGRSFSTMQDFLAGRINPETGLNYYWPELMFPNNQTRDHMFRANFDYRYLKDEGPELFGFKILENAGINVLFRANSGWHWTRQNFRGESVEERGSSVGPWFYNLDIKLNKDFRVFRTYTFSIFAEIYNVLNTTQILGLHARTGDPLLVGDEVEIQASNFPDGIDRFLADGTENPRWQWEKVKDTNGDEHISSLEEYNGFMKSFLFLRRTATNFGPPRLVRFGFRVYF